MFFSDVAINGMGEENKRRLVSESQRNGQTKRAKLSPKSTSPQIARNSNPIFIKKIKKAKSAYSQVSSVAASASASASASESESVSSVAASASESESASASASASESASASASASVPASAAAEITKTTTSTKIKIKMKIKKSKIRNGYAPVIGESRKIYRMVEESSGLTISCNKTDKGAKPDTCLERYLRTGHQLFLRPKQNAKEKAITDAADEWQRNSHLLHLRVRIVIYIYIHIYVI